MKAVTINYLIDELKYIKNNTCGVSGDTKVYLYNNEYGANKMCKELLIEANEDNRKEVILVLSDI